MKILFAMAVAGLLALSACAAIPGATYTNVDTNTAMSAWGNDGGQF
jgi:ABC-type glycerol-3-phosphate transport system substrate-binding protein